MESIHKYQIVEAGMKISIKMKREKKRSKNLTNVEASKNYVKKKLKHDFGIESGGSRRRFVGIEDTRVTDLCY